MPNKLDFNQQPNFPQLEEEVQKFWEEDKTFEKSVQNRPEDNPYIFYDGPPFATGLPHYGHLLGSTSKDVIPRYQTMKGKRVERVWGWDCHGLPIENMIEKKLEIKGGKKGIEDLGIANFNNACQSEVLRLDKEWEKIIGRLGRWADFQNNYKTMDKNYMESVWWGFKRLFDKGLVYEGHKVILYCPRCATPLSNFEIAMDNSYKDVEDWSVYLKFHVKNSKNEYLVAWTTTPWTLPGNVALAVAPDADYVKVELNGEYFWMAKSLYKKVTEKVEKDSSKVKVVEEVKGSSLAGIEYEPLFNYVDVGDKKSHYVAVADFVSMEDGTGIVHTAALFGEDDYALALKLDLPLVPTLDDQGKFLDFVTPFAGMFYKKAEKFVNEDLESRNLMFLKEKMVHSYPHCYRCDTPLYFNALPAWFVNVQKLKDSLIETNESINWFPEHLKYGRFKKGLEGAPDWNISRSRYWGTPMPIWKAHDAEGVEHLRIIGSIEELQKWAVDADKVADINNIHREFIDDVEVWVDDEKTLKGMRIPEVFDCWVESGSMPYASVHYPFENKEKFEKAYPAQFISEYIAQTRAWFYTMHVMSVGIFDKPAFENVLTTGTILAEDGSKMSKSKNNYPDPMLLINNYGVDSLRLYMMSSTVMKSENLNFNEKEVADIRRKVFVIWWNVYGFYKNFANLAVGFSKPDFEPDHVMDKWLLERVVSLTKEVTEQMDNYDVVRASRNLMVFVDELSTWYLRLSRDRFRDKSLNHQSSQVFGFAIYTLAQLFAPVTPFFSEVIHQDMTGNNDSIHLTNWPDFADAKVDADLLAKMEEVKMVVEKIRAKRQEIGIKVRQPLASATVKSRYSAPTQDLLEVMALELNVKKVLWEVSKEDDVLLDTNITPELKAEGEARDVMRQIQNMRRKAGLKVGQVVEVTLKSWPESWQDEIEKKTDVRLKKGEEEGLVS
jgi:isoleucyl-tRNA synthetase